MFILTQYLKAIVPLENISYISKEKVDDDGYSVITCAGEKTHGFNRGMIACNISS